MLQTQSIQEIPTDHVEVAAFRITGTVTRDDFAAMGARMLDIFDGREGTIDMLLHFDAFEGSEPFAGLSGSGIESRLKSLTRVSNYVVAEAPETAAKMVEAVGAILPVDTQAFDDVRDAWAFLGAVPQGGGSAATA